MSELPLIMIYGCSIPYSVDDLSSTMEDQTFSDVKPPAELLENSDFQFLQE